MIKGFTKGVVWWKGENELFLVARTSFGRYFVRMASLPKMGGKQVGTLDACQRGE